MLRVLVDALIRIVPDLAGEAQHIGALGCEPLVEQVVGEPLPQLDVGHLPQPGLGDDQHEQATGDDQEYQELVREGRHVLLLDRVVEVALPHVEPDLPRSIGADHENDASAEETEPVSVARGRERACQAQELGDDAVARSARRRLRRPRFREFVVHLWSRSQRLPAVRVVARAAVRSTCTCTG